MEVTQARKEAKVLDWIEEIGDEIDVGESDRSGATLLGNLDLVTEEDIDYHRGKGIEGFRVLAGLVKSRLASEETENSRRILRIENEVLNGRDPRPHPELKEPPTRKRKKKVEPPEPFPEE